VPEVLEATAGEDAAERHAVGDFTFSDFGIRFSVTPPPASQIDHDTGVGVQF
jgi:hypothetical protein